MSVAILVSGSLFKAPELKTSKSGKTYATASIRTASADNITTADFWNLLVFSETASTELMRLSEGEKLAAQGSLKLEIYNGKISRTVFVDAILPLRRERKPKAASASAASAKKPAPTSQEQASTNPDFDDPIPFAPEWR
jgi:single-stranded DNA-binding protein